MPSPFPGMDPYLEPHWLDVHTRMVTYAADELNARLPDDLIASTEERVAVESEVGEVRDVGPDVRVFEPPAAATTVIDSAGGAAAVAPYRLLALPDPITERFIRVVEAGTERLVTVVEFISPTNKQGEGLRAFRRKRVDLLATGVNLVEVDLVRGGDWRALLRPHVCSAQLATPFRTTIRLPDEPGVVYLHPFKLRESLPPITIPLRAGDVELRVGLQPLLEQVYDKGRYERRLDYRRPCDPPLEPEDAAWADELLRGSGRR